MWTFVTLTDPAAEVRKLCGPDAVVETAGTVEMTLPAEPRSAGIARRYVHGRWQQLDGDAMDDIELIVCELVSNAVRHGRPDIILRLQVSPFAVDVAVVDHGPDLPPTELPHADGAATSGRGLGIVDRLANRWGVAEHDDAPGKTVWATVRR